MIDDPDLCYSALQARDPRFDGWFSVGVTSTGIYCRPSCPARTPHRHNVRFFATSAAAQRAGFRACKRCRPDATPGSPEWDLRTDLVGRAMRLIADGIVDREGVVGLATRLGYSSRHVHRQLVTELGAGPLELARAQRAQTARVLIETTRLPFTEVAYAAGFSSVRQFNDTVREVFVVTPTQLRRRVRRGVEASQGGALVLRLPARAPAALDDAVAHLAARQVDGLEEVAADGTYRRAFALPGGEAIAEMAARSDHVRATLRLQDLRDLTAAVQRCRRMLDLDADPEAVDAHLGADPALRSGVATTPGLRVPGCGELFEAAVRAVLGQQVSLAGGRRFLARLVERSGDVLRHPVGEVTRRFPTPAELANTDLAGIGLTRRRELTVRSLAVAVADGRVTMDVGADRDELRRALLALDGVGAWTVAEVALRGLGDPDAFPASDLVLRRVAASLGLPGDARELQARAERWRPWRAYAAQHLWRMERSARRRAA
jgi:AraC family transcriptional regulator, regulatory protein of adaptative response / DNA-3-methyladenine glycosylase II